MSINVFTDFDIETDSDVITLLFKIDEQVWKFTEKRMQTEFCFQTQSVLASKYPEINNRSAKFVKTKKLQENIIVSQDDFPCEEYFQHESEQMNEMCEQIKRHLVDTNRVVKKGTSGISVKVYSE